MPYKNLIKESFRVGKLKETFKENIGEITDPSLNTEKVYKILQGYISKMIDKLAERNFDYYSGDRYSTFNVEEFKSNLYDKMKSKIKSRTEGDKLIFENLPKIKDERGFYDIVDYDYELDMFLSDIVKMEVEEIVNVLVGKTLRGSKSA